MRAMCLSGGKTPEAMDYIMLKRAVLETFTLDESNC